MLNDTIFKFMICCCFVACVAACAPVYKTEYRFSTPPTQEGKICANNCLDKMQACQNNCKAQKADCRHIKSLEAENAYLRYVNERQRQKKKVEKEKHHFENYSSCNTSCEQQCEATQRICHVNCGGNITETKRCTAFCDR